jgi:hypothetical protein
LAALSGDGALILKIVGSGDFEVVGFGVGLLIALIVD